MSTTNQSTTYFAFHYCVEKRFTTQYGGDLVMLQNVILRLFLLIKNKILIIGQNKWRLEKQPNMGEML